MKKLFIFVVTLMLSIGYSQSKGALLDDQIPQEPQRAEDLMNQLIMKMSSEDNIEELTKIRSQFNELMLIKPSLKKKSIIVSREYSTEGGDLNYFIDENENVLIVDAEFLGESGRWEEEYYYYNDSLFFLHSVRGAYNSPIYWETFDMNKTTYYANQYYFHNGSLIIWLNQDGVEVSRDSEEFDEKQKSKWEESQELLTKYHITDWQSID